MKQTRCDDCLHIGAVGFLNARPLTYLLDDQDDINLTLALPSKLGRMLDDGIIQAGLVPSIDYQMTQGRWIVLPAGAIGSNGDVMTVRVYSNSPLEKVDTLYCDTDSHSSIVLARIIFQMQYSRQLQVKDISQKAFTTDSLPGNSSMLLIGDKVVLVPGSWEYELDLGGMWTELTYLPFVYAFWAISAADIKYAAWIYEILSNSAAEGLKHIDKIASDYGLAHGFSLEEAYGYLKDNISYEFTDMQIRALKEYYSLAYKYGFIPENKPLEVYKNGKG